tara:strand:- start:1070 stop:1327 length:258 start_codon:yes stop_codon:yes gene_type:complete
MVRVPLMVPRVLVIPLILVTRVLKLVPPILPKQFVVVMVHVVMHLKYVCVMQVLVARNVTSLANRIVLDTAVAMLLLVYLSVNVL